MAIESDLPQTVIERIRAGEETALGEAFAHYRERLWRCAHFRMDKRLAGRVDADDILQESFLNSAQRIRHFPQDEEVSCFLWFRLIVQQTLIDVHRRHISAQRRDASRERSIQAPAMAGTSVALAGHLLAGLTSPSGVAVKKENAYILERALESMNEIDREVLALRHFEELTNNEVAELLGITKKAASNRYARALVRLREIMEEIPEFNSSDS